MKKFYVGVKGIIHDYNKGFLVLKATKGHWDTPGGRMDEGEDFDTALARELSEELPGSDLKSIEGLEGVFRLPKDIDGDISLVLVYFLITAKLPEELQLSEEHESYVWVKKVEEIPDGLNQEVKRILERHLKA